jgi:hypothetical protein
MIIIIALTLSLVKRFSMTLLPNKVNRKVISSRNNKIVLFLEGKQFKSLALKTEEEELKISNLNFYSTFSYLSTTKSAFP